MSRSELSLRRSFGRAQIAALAATALDFVIYVALVELLSVWYVAAAAVGALCGAVCNFLLGRHWCFAAHEGHLTRQGIRYATVATGSLLLNTGGVFVFTDLMQIHYLVSKVLIATLVAVLFNFPLQRFYVFAK